MCWLLYIYIMSIPVTATIYTSKSIFIYYIELEVLLMITASTCSIMLHLYHKRHQFIKAFLFYFFSTEMIDSFITYVKLDVNLFFVFIFSLGFRLFCVFFCPLRYFWRFELKFSGKQHKKKKNIKCGGCKRISDLVIIFFFFRWIVYNWIATEMKFVINENNKKIKIKSPLRPITVLYTIHEHTHSFRKFYQLNLTNLRSDYDWINMFSA